MKNLSSKIRDMDDENQSVLSNRKSLTLEKASLVKEKNEMQYQVENLQKVNNIYFIIIHIFYLLLSSYSKFVLIKESERYRKKSNSITELESRIRRLQKGFIFILFIKKKKKTCFNGN